MEARVGSLDTAQVPLGPPHFCAVCRARLIITTTAPDADKPGGSGAAGGMFDASRIEESFIVLNDDRRSQTHATQAAGLPQGIAYAPGAGPGPPRGLDESFVLLPTGMGPRGGTSGRLTGAGAALQSATQQPGPQVPAGTSSAPAQQAQEGASGLDAKLQALSQLFDLAAANMQVDQPLCLDCASQLKDEIEAQIHEAEQEIACYASALAATETQSSAPLPESEFQAQLTQLRAAQQEQRSAAQHAEHELEAARRELAALQAAATDLAALEETYWHDYNGFQAGLKAHVEERDALLVRIGATNQRKTLLQATNVYNDAFKIWHDGPFATISGFRLGRTPEVLVEWDEINAAWGQAVLLLYTMAQSCQITFNTARLIPMGSHPRVADKRATYDLFGPVSKLWSSNYDRAMACYLGCLKEFGDFAAEMDASIPGERTFEGYPFTIDGDKVNGHTIKLSLNKDAKWTKALKFMLANLKKALQWMVKYDAWRAEQEASARVAVLRPEPALL